MRKKDSIKNCIARIALPLLFLLAGGCLSIKTQHEIKPIEINMNIKLSMDQELDRYFGSHTEGEKE